MKPKKSRASTSSAARKYRKKGHDDALQFAKLIGLQEDYKNDKKAKKDVIDPSGDAHSLKSGQKKWQIFLYTRNRFIEDPTFGAMNGIGEILVCCIDSFPKHYADYTGRRKWQAKEKLRKSMRDLKEKLSHKSRLKAFLSKSIFNSGEVNYLTVKHEGQYHVFLNKDIIDLLSQKLKVENSKARQKGQVDEQKVLLKYNNINIGEIEMRNDSKIHYKEIRFNMYKQRVMEILFKEMGKPTKWRKKIFVYKQARKKFGNWKKKKQRQTTGQDAN